MSASLAVGRQFMRGRDVLVTPVLTPNVSSYSGESTAFLVWARSHSKTQPPFFTAYVPQTAFLPSRRRVIWCDWYPNNHESEELVSCRWKRKEKKNKHGKRRPRCASRTCPFAYALGRRAARSCIRIRVIETARAPQHHMPRSFFKP